MHGKLFAQRKARAVVKKPEQLCEADVLTGQRGRYRLCGEVEARANLRVHRGGGCDDRELFGGLCFTKAADESADHDVGEMVCVGTTAGNDLFNGATDALRVSRTRDTASHVCSQP